MGRRRKYALDAKGKTVDGLSFHKSSQSYYSIGKDGQRAWFGRDRDRAVAAYRASLEPKKDLYFGRDGKPRFWTPEEARERKSYLQLVWPQEKRPGLPEPSRERLNDSFDAWKQWRAGDAAPQTIADTKRLWDRFVDAVGNLPVNQITHDDFVKWQQAVKKRCKGLSAKSADDHHKAVAKVLKFAKRKNRKWAFPDGLVEWLDDWKLDKRTPYVPKKSNSQPMPVDVYGRFLVVADQWAAAELAECSGGRGVAAGKRRQALLKQRQGVQFAAVLRLAIHGLANIDCARIEWSDLHLDAELPYFDFPRTKCQHKTGFAVDRKTPLLPSTVSALKRWRAFEKPSKSVFRTSQKRPFSTNSLWQVIEKMRDEADGNGWSFKHLRNVGGTLGDKGGLSEMVIDRFLGHTLKRERAKYLGDVDASYLVPLVNLIGREYSDGEQVG